MTQPAIQFVDSAKNEEEAHEMLTALRQQDGYLGGRVLPATDINPQPRLQAFFVDDSDPHNPWLPDGCRRVFVPIWLLAKAT